MQFDLSSIDCLKHSMRTVCKSKAALLMYALWGLLRDNQGEHSRQHSHFGVFGCYFDNPACTISKSLLPRSYSPTFQIGSMSYLRQRGGWYTICTRYLVPAQASGADVDGRSARHQFDLPTPSSSASNHLLQRHQRTAKTTSLAPKMTELPRMGPSHGASPEFGTCECSTIISSGLVLRFQPIGCFAWHLRVTWNSTKHSGLYVILLI